MSGGHELAEQRLRELRALSSDELIGYVQRPVATDVTDADGMTWRLMIDGYHDEEEDEVCVKVKLHGRGLRLLQRYHGAVHRYGDEGVGDEDDEVDSLWLRLIGEVIAVALLIVVIAPWFIGVGFLISLLL